MELADESARRLLSKHVLVEPLVRSQTAICGGKADKEARDQGALSRGTAVTARREPQKQQPDAWAVSVET